LTPNRSRAQKLKYAELVEDMSRKSVDALPEPDGTVNLVLVGHIQVPPHMIHTTPEHLRLHSLLESMQQFIDHGIEWGILDARCYKIIALCQSIYLGTRASDGGPFIGMDPIMLITYLKSSSALPIAMEKLHTIHALAEVLREHIRNEH
jgi:hypothetical protein